MKVKQLLFQACKHTCILLKSSRWNIELKTGNIFLSSYATGLTVLETYLFNLKEAQYFKANIFLPSKSINYFRNNETK